MAPEYQHPEGPKYPDVRVQLTGVDRNIFSVIGRVGQELARATRGHAVPDEFAAYAMDAENYDDALARVMEWVSVY